MECPVCKKSLDQAILLNVEVDYCPKCLGMWFNKNELAQAKDKKDPSINWLDVDLWRDVKKLEVSRGNKLCPECRMPLYEVQYDESKTKIDLCNVCHGVWLDKGEFNRIIEYLKERSDYEVLYNFSRNLVQEFGEIFVGPESFRLELLDFFTLLKLLTYKFSVLHPYITELIRQGIPK
jgi:Zn-finger nucleic acid-binding protein